MNGFSVASASPETISTSCSLSPEKIAHIEAFVKKELFVDMDVPDIPYKVEHIDVARANGYTGDEPALYNTETRTIYFDGKNEAEFAHELAHHYTVQFVGMGLEETSEMIHWKVWMGDVSPPRFAMELWLSSFLDFAMTPFRKLAEFLDPNGAYPTTGSQDLLMAYKGRYVG